MKKKLLFKILIFVLCIFLSESVYAYDDEDISDEMKTKAAIAYKKGVSLEKMRAYDRAISCFNEALSYDPKMYDAYYNIASIYVKQKKYDEAYNAYIKVIALNPSDYDSILQAAKISYNRQNYSLALKYLKYIPEDSKDADTTENLYIEGDNLEVLKLIRQNYYGAIKMRFRGNV